MHFYYFAVLAMLSGFCDWRVLVVAAGLVALHHLTLDLVLPNAVYPGASDLKRVAVHAVVVVIETAMLIFIGRAIIAAFEAARRNGTDAERLAGDLHRLVARTGLVRHGLAGERGRRRGRPFPGRDRRRGAPPARRGDGAAGQCRRARRGRGSGRAADHGRRAGVRADEPDRLGRRRGRRRSPRP